MGSSGNNAPGIGSHYIAVVGPVMQHVVNSLVLGPPAIEGYSYVGCFVDSGNRDIAVASGVGLSEALFSDARVMQCAEACDGYAYMGLQWVNECFCDNVGDGAESSRAGGIDNVDQLVHGVGPASACRVAHTGEVSEVREAVDDAVRVARRDLALALGTVVVVAEALVVPLETHVGVASAALGAVHDTVGGGAGGAAHANSDVTRAGINEAADVAVARHSADNLGVHGGTANGDDVVGANARGVVAAKADRAGRLSVVHPPC